MKRMLLLAGAFWRGWAPARGALVLCGVALLAAALVLSGWMDWSALGRWARPLAVPLALLAVAASGLVVAVARRRGERAPRARASAMSWWVVVAAAIVVAAVGWAATSWLLGEANQAGDADKRAAARVEAIKTGLGIGAGTTGTFALLLAVRRQQHNESDATEKNVTELYTKAADQLGSEKAPVRMAGLYALERLAHNNPGQRQSIVNVICAYLRMPFNPPNAQPTAEADEAQRTEHHSRVQEQEVRLAAQRILADHLEPGNRQTFWPDTDLDLTNAILIRFKLKDCRVRTASFRDATFIGGVVFTGSTFTGDAWFAGTAFGDNAWFVDTAFAGDARFDRAIFTSDAVFARATFSGDAWFHSATFTVTAWFGMHGDGATFSGDARFSAATFNGNARFDDVTFTGNARFDDATFTGNACFEDASFTGDAVFSGVDFAGRSVFVGTTFNKGLPLTLSDDALSPG